MLTVHELVLKSCNRGLLSIEVPILLNVIVGKVDWAIKEYQTSAELVFPQNAFIPAVAVALFPLSLRVPAVLVHVVPEVNVVAFPQASLVGCAKEIFGKRSIAEKISERNIFLKPKQYFISGQSWLFK